MTRLPRSATRAVRAASAAALGVAAGTALGAAVAVSAPTAAHADTYRYWTYWKAAPGQSSWGFSPAGASSRPADGAVEGWRFALSGVAGSGGTKPRATPSFDRICGATPPTADGVRVAVVVDFGTADARPPGESPPRGVVEYCATRAPNITGLEALADGPWGSAVRTGGGLVCGIDGYPRTECGALVTSPTPAPAPPAPPAAAVPPAPAPKPPAPATSRPTSPTPLAPGTAGSTASQSPATPAPSAGAELASAAPGGEPAAAAADAADAALAAPASTQTDGPDRPSGPPAISLAGFGLVAALGGAAWWRMRVGR